jgi:hypothetical protein
MKNPFSTLQCFLQSVDQPFSHILDYPAACGSTVAAERRAVELYNDAKLTNATLRDGVMCVRAMGYFLIEFHAGIFVISDSPCFEIIHHVCVTHRG